MVANSAEEHAKIMPEPFNMPEIKPCKAPRKNAIAADIFKYERSTIKRGLNFYKWLT